MIFAHGPLGFLSSFVLKRWRKRLQLSRHNVIAISVIAWVGGIFPDIDLFYYYGVNAALGHREFITHTPALYLAVCAVLVPLSIGLRRPKIALGVGAFTIGTMTHVFADAIAGQVMFLYPFSYRLYGLWSIGNPVFNSNLLFINFFAEGIVFLCFFYMLIRLSARTVRSRIIAMSVLLAVFTLGVATLLYANQRVYHANPEVMRFADADGDSIVNYHDPDMDGDGAANLQDLDSNGNGKSNIEDIVTNRDRFTGVCYDSTEGGLLQLPARLGCITNNDVVWRVYDSAGVYVHEEMLRDYTQRPDGYALPSTSPEFDRDARNIRAWVAHVGVIETSVTLENGRNQIGDILFFENGYLAVITGFTQNGEPTVVDIARDRPIAQRLLADVQKDEGVVAARGKVLNSAALFGRE